MIDKDFLIVPELASTSDRVTRRHGYSESDNFHRALFY